MIALRLTLTKIENKFSPSAGAGGASVDQSAPHFTQHTVQDGAFWSSREQDSGERDLRAHPARAVYYAGGHREGFGSGTEGAEVSDNHQRSHCNAVSYTYKCWNIVIWDVLSIYISMVCSVLFVVVCR